MWMKNRLRGNLIREIPLIAGFLLLFLIMPARLGISNDFYVLGKGFSGIGKDALYWLLIHAPVSLLLSYQLFEDIHIMAVHFLVRGGRIWDCIRRELFIQAVSGIVFYLSVCALVAVCFGGRFWGSSLLWYVALSVTQLVSFGMILLIFCSFTGDYVVSFTGALLWRMATVLFTFEMPPAHKMLLFAAEWIAAVMMADKAVLFHFERIMGGRAYDTNDRIVKKI